MTNDRHMNRTCLLQKGAAAFRLLLLCCFLLSCFLQWEEEVGHRCNAKGRVLRSPATPPPLPERSKRATADADRPTCLPACLRIPKPSNNSRPDKGRGRRSTTTNQEERKRTKKPTHKVTCTH
ncbi:hypothetical protein B0T19DRAFT_412844 [Cercophora scortea]|uniref:Secreted protein n=1 Tax=Cercophora scortea TaxID=314031 RepID=A0AAE0J6J3_9PEZI|nr:hypothetical protein B0T19DRAFT_412844 [Cercophora scortea]